MKAGLRVFFVLVPGILILSILILGALWPAPSGARAAEFIDTPCWFNNDGDRPASCGKLMVPVRHEAPDGPMLTLPVVILARPAPGGARVPIVVLTGGPGGPAYIATSSQIDYWRAWAANLPEEHDVILFDLRGVGLSEPNLRCPALADPLVWAPASLRPGQQSDPLPRYLEALERCRDELLAQGHDLGAYNSKQNALDIVALRQALGVERWTLFGYSYGSALALTVLRYDQAAVHSLILDGVVPPHYDDSAQIASLFDRSFQRILADCAASPVCAAAYPALESRLGQVLRSLAAKPVELILETSRRQDKLYVRIDDVQFLAMLLWALYDKRVVPFVPDLIERTAKGDYFYFNGLALNFYLNPYWQEESIGVVQSFSCHEEFPFEDQSNFSKQAERFPHLAAWVMQFKNYQACENWPSGQAEPSVKDPVSSAVPALLLAGAYDPRTPLPLAEMAAEHLPNGHVFEFRSGSHGVTLEDGCPFRVVAAFLDEPFTRPQPPCLNWEAPASFETSFQ